MIKHCKICGKSFIDYRCEIVEKKSFNYIGCGEYIDYLNTYGIYVGICEEKHETQLLTCFLDKQILNIN